MARRFLTALGETKSIRDWALDQRSSASSGVIRSRLSRGWTDEDSVLGRGTSLVHGAHPRMISAFGEIKSTPEWELDPRCKVSRSTLLLRLTRGWEAEDAIAMPPKNRTDSRPIVKQRYGKGHSTTRRNGLKASDTHHWTIRVTEEEIAEILKHVPRLNPPKTLRALVEVLP